MFINLLKALNIYVVTFPDHQPKSLTKLVLLTLLRIAGTNLFFFVRVKFRGIFQDIRRPMARPVINSGDSLLVGKPEMMGKTYTVRHLFGVILNII